MRRIARDEIAKGLETVAQPPKSVNSPISDDERHFVMAIAACKQGRADTAIGHLKRAVSMGLPIERIVAGPRDLFEPLKADEEFRKWLDQRTPKLLHGPMLSSLGDTFAGFWVRTADSVDVQIRLVAAEADNDSKEDSVVMVSDPVTSTGETDYTATVALRDLKPMTRYQYVVLVDGLPVGQPLSFKTFPTAGSPARFKIGFGGGAGYTPQFHRMWDTIRNQSLSAFLMLGDNVYIDDPEHPLTQHYCYYRRQSQPQWRSLVASTGMFSIYDDHDFGENDCVPGPAIDTPAWKRSVWDVFRQNWNNPGYGGGPAQPGCWYDFTIADIHFIMLDGRYYRDLEGGSMLGPVQKDWLLKTLAGSSGKFKFLVSPVPWSPGVKPRSKDTWDGFAEEREEIFSHIHREKIDGVVLMAADRHRSDLRRIPRRDGYDFYELMSSRLTNVHTHGLVEKANGSDFIMGYNEKCSFGQVTLDTTVTDPTLEYSIISIDNETVGTHTLKLSQLRDETNVSASDFNP